MAGPEENLVLLTLPSFDSRRRPFRSFARQRRATEFATCTYLVVVPIHVVSFFGHLQANIGDLVIYVGISDHSPPHTIVAPYACKDTEE